MRKKTLVPSNPPMREESVSPPVSNDVESAALRWREMAYQALTDSISQGVMVASTDGVVIYANRALAQMAGRDPGQLAGTDLVELVAEECRVSFGELITRCEDSTCTGETFLARPAPQTPLPVGLSISRVAADRHKATIVIVTDLSERKQNEQRLRQHQEHLEELVETRTKDLRSLKRQLESSKQALQSRNLELATVNQRLTEEIEEHKCAVEALRESEESYSNLVKHAPAAIYETDIKGEQFLSVNDAMCVFLGYTRDELLALRPRDLLDSHSKRIFANRIRKMLSGEKPEASAEYRVRRKDGTWIYVAANVGEIVYHNGLPARVSVVAHDVTERRIAQEQLSQAKAEAEHRAQELQALMDAVPSAVFITHDPDARNIIGNKAASELLGEPQGANVSQTAPPSERAVRWVEMRNGEALRPEDLPAQRAARGEQVVDFEMDLVFDDGSVRTVLSNAVPLLDESGNPHGSITTLADVSRLKESEEAVMMANARLERAGYELSRINAELAIANEELGITNEELKRSNDELQQEVQWRKTIQRELQETRDFLESLFQCANAPVLVWDNYYRITRFNRAAEMLTGYEAEEVLGQQLRVLFPENTRDESFDTIQSIPSETMLDTVEIPILRKDGEVRIVLWNSAHIHGPGALEPVATIAQGQDITDRKRAEAEVLHARADAERHAAELVSFISSIPDGVVLLDKDGNITYTNEACHRMFGVHPGERFSERFWNYARLDDNGDGIPIERWPSLQGLKGGTVRDVPQRMVSPEGAEIALSISASPVYGPHGVVVGATAVFRDVSERVELEKRREEVYRREHRISDTLQRVLIPSHVNHTVPGSRIGVKYQPAMDDAEVGGDFYDIFALDENLFGILIGDVAGKGLTAAMRVAAARHAVRSYAFLNTDPALVLSLANAMLARDDTDMGGMLTAFFAVLDTTTSLLTYASAGHEPPVILDSRNIVHELHATGLPLGVRDDAQYTQNSHRLRPGDVLLMMTDGITEARTPSKGLFGKAGVVDFIENCCNNDPQEIANGLMEAALAHAGGKLQDDAAILAFVLEK